MSPLNLIYLLGAHALRAVTLGVRVAAQAWRSSSVQRYVPTKIRPRDLRFPSSTLSPSDHLPNSLWGGHRVTGAVSGQHVMRSWGQPSAPVCSVTAGPQLEPQKSGARAHSPLIPLDYHPMADPCVRRLDHSWIHESRWTDGSSLF